MLDVPGERLDYVSHHYDHWDDYPGERVMVVGGGRWVDAVRREDHRRRLDERTAHWMCIDAMSITARLLADWMPEAVLLDDLGSFVASAEKTTLAILNPRRFLQEMELALRGERLPES